MTEAASTIPAGMTKAASTIPARDHTTFPARGTPHSRHAAHHIPGALLAGAPQNADSSRCMMSLSRFSTIARTPLSSGSLFFANHEATPTFPV